MIQELLGVVEDRKIPISGGFLGVTTEPVGSSCSSAHSTITSSTSSAAATSTTSSSTSNNAEQQNLRCPRCDSTNTKFCYYNNYNLTQPRHFCKTCRRYWTQGGALRNVPIGGGCRKTKSAGISLSAGKTGNGVGIKAKSPSSTDAVGAGKPSGFGAAGFGAGPMGFEHDLQSSPILWAAPQNSHLLSLLRAAQSSGVSCTNTSNVISNPNPNSIRNTNIHPTRVKEDGPMVGSHLVPEASLLISALNARNLGLDPLGQVPLGLCNSLWRSSQYQHPLQHQQAQHQQPVPLQQQQPQPQPQPQPQQNNNGFLLSESPGSGIQELIQRLRSTTNYTDHQAVVLGNGCSSSSSPAIVPFSTPTAATTTTATVLEPAPISGGEFGCWNSSAAPFTWASDHMPNINGAFP